ncbi:MAG TPA: hypothetical protein DEO87_03795 [Lachnospiraceae bacterium]|nr:hypothetical protein [Lachnospiraceae bacterium]
MNRNIEILAPCGSKSSFEAAINAGADAVYLAGNRFGARAYAENFSDEDLCRAIEKAHLKGVKVYLTVNTLFKNAEIQALPEYLRPFYEVGLDAVIVQDLGVFSVVRDVYPDLPIHASTQMNICSSEGAEFLKRLGAERVIPARELTLAEIKSIKEKVDTEVEVFVHGAMCYCYSGRCLFSSMAGDRSGNRGRCAQPCRRRYNDAYLMSMKDMCALPYVPQLIEAGVDSLKIEGRMKGDYYTASVVDAYRQMADDALAGCFSMKKADRYIEKLSETFSRGGFCNGYFDKAELPYMIDSSAPGHKGMNVGEVVTAGRGKVTIKARKDIGIRDVLTIDLGRNEGVEITSNVVLSSGKTAVFNTSGSSKIKQGAGVFRKINKAVLDGIRSELIDREKLMPVDVTVILKQGEPLSLKLSSGVYEKTVSGSVCMRAEKRAVSDEVIRDKMRGFGELGYKINNLEIINDNESFISFGELKSLRREAAAGLDEMILSGFRRTVKTIDTIKQESDLDKEDNHSLTTNTSTGCKISREKKTVYFSVVNEKAAAGLKKVFEDRGSALNDENEYIFGFTVDMFTGNMLCELKDHFSQFGRTVAELPFIHREEDEEYFSTLYNKLSDDGFDMIHVRNIDDLATILMNDNRRNYQNMDIILAHSIYAYNNKAISFIYLLLKDRFRKILFECPHELTLAEQNGLSYPEDCSVILPVYGKEELMITAQEPDGKSKGFLKDERGGAYRYFKSRDLCYNTLIDLRPIMLDLADDKAMNSMFKDSFNNRSAVMIKISLHDESSEVIRKIIEYFATGDAEIRKSIKASEGHFYKAIL